LREDLDMTKEQLSEVLALCEAQDKDGSHVIPPGRHLTMHLAAGGVGLTVSRVTSLLESGTRVQAKTAKGETYFFELQDVFACAIEEKGEATRKAGFV
jgi:hypothetical protein